LFISTLLLTGEESFVHPTTIPLPTPCLHPAKPRFEAFVRLFFINAQLLLRQILSRIGIVPLDFVYFFLTRDTRIFDVIKGHAEGEAVCWCVSWVLFEGHALSFFVFADRPFRVRLTLMDTSSQARAKALIKLAVMDNFGVFSHDLNDLVKRILCVNRNICPFNLPLSKGILFLLIYRLV